MEFPESLWINHRSQKQGLIPRQEAFDGNTASAAVMVVHAAYSNPEREFDCLMTHVVLYGLNTAFVNNCDRVELRHLKQTGQNIVIQREVNSVDVGGSLGITLNLITPILLRFGESLLGYGYYNAAHASNYIEGTGVGWYLPRLVI